MIIAWRHLTQVHNNFADAIKVATKGVLHEHVARGRGLSAAEVKALDGARYKDVCSRLREDHFDSCLALSFIQARPTPGLPSMLLILMWLCRSRGLTRQLLGVLRSHDRMLRHTLADETAAATADGPNGDGGGDGGGDDGAGGGGGCDGGGDAARRLAAVRRLRHALQQARPTIWDLMQRRVAVYIGSALPPSASLPLSNLFDVVSATRAFMGVGEAFAGTDSHGLRSALHAKVGVVVFRHGSIHSSIHP